MALKNIIGILISAICLFIPGINLAQKPDSTATWSVSAYADVYYAHYTDSVGIGAFQKFPTVSPRNNQVGLNTAQINFQYDAEKMRATVALHFGDIAQSTWSPAYNSIMEAHAGLKICKMLWVDAGFFRTHFGTEFLLPKENITSSVSIGTYYEPYYESGARLNFDPTKRLEINIFLLNGYGIFNDNNHKKSFGAGITYVLNDFCGIGYTNYIGDDSPDGSRVSHTRYHNNAFLNYEKKKIKLQIGGDFCIQNNSDTTGSKNAFMYSGLATFKYQFKPKYGIYCRGEVFNDPQGFMSALIRDNTGTQTGYKLWGATAGLEYKPTENSYIRLESRRLQMDKNQEIFHYDGQNRDYRIEVMINMGISFDVIKGSAIKQLNH